MNEVSELQQKRAVNIIWNGAGNYGFAPDFKAYDADGNAELYWNCIIGAVRRHYDYPKLEKIFQAFQQYEDSDTYEGLLWLGLENSASQREAADRPAITELRRNYARRFVEEYGRRAPDDYRLYDCLALAHYMRVLGMEPKLGKYDVKLLDELEFTPDMSTDDIAARTRELFTRWFQINTEYLKRQKKPFTLSLKKTERAGKRRYRKFGIGFADHPSNIYGGVSAEGRKDSEEIRTKMTAAELREFMTVKYGLPLFDAQTAGEIERRLCSGNHSGCHLHFTKGEPVKGKIQNGFEALQRTREAAQRQKNRDSFKANLPANRTSIAKLAAKIQNSVLLHLQPAPVRSNSGTIDGGRVWRAVALDDDKVFTRSEQDNMGDLSVDILLDASTSQKNRQETVSAQGYMIAEALTRCSIPCRVMSFCSMTGYTILRVFRDYTENRKNDSIFDFVSNGCNRDGLAVRAAHYLMNRSNYEHKILIVLSDVKPNDIKKLPGGGEDEFVPYEHMAGITDTAYEVRRARADGIAVICVFTGEDGDLASAKLVYGRDFARIQSVGKLADTVGMLIQNQIRNL
ncbi:MAG: hypothetical protein VB039_07480 [Oscillospiraceae bacterium]|nr:hypothetical protein [Oscillospiraceae bacterium]